MPKEGTSSLSGVSRCYVRVAGPARPPQLSSRGFPLRFLTANCKRGRAMVVTLRNSSLWTWQVLSPRAVGPSFLKHARAHPEGMDRRSDELILTVPFGRKTHEFIKPY